MRKARNCWQVPSLYRTSNTKFYSVEASRRLDESFKLELEARFFYGRMTISGQG